jgi:hypothetical protein
MDSLRDLKKLTSNQKMVEYVEVKRNLSINSIGVINKISVRVIEERLI